MKENKQKRPRRDSNPQSSDPKSDALSIRPRGQTGNKLVNCHYVDRRRGNQQLLTHGGGAAKKFLAVVYVDVHKITETCRNSVLEVFLSLK